MTYEKITDPPKTVKEAIDWILRVTKKDSRQSGINYENFCKSLTAVLGDGANIQKTHVEELGKELSKFIGWNDEGKIKTGVSVNNGIAAQNYTSAYKADGWDGSNANWPTACRDAKEANKNSGRKCCSSNCPTCQTNPNVECEEKGCCKNCPKQICARIFCLIVPVLHSVFSFLSEKLDSDDNAWQGQNLPDGEVGLFFKVCGFDTQNLVKGITTQNIKSQVKSVVEKLTAVKQALDKALQTDSAKGKFLESATKGNNSKPPSSVCDFLQWIQFLPYCTDYKSVMGKLKEHINGTPNTGGRFENFLQELTSHIPMLFLFIEDQGNTNPQKGNSIFQKIETLSKCQPIFDEKYYETDKAAKILLSVLPILHWSFEKLKEKCKSGNSSTIVESNETKKFLVCLGWVENSTAGSDPKIRGTMQCTNLKKYLESTLVGAKGTLKTVKEALVAAWKDSSVASSASSPGSSQGQHEPQTIREMLLWLQGLPASDGFSKMKEHIKSKLSDISGQLDSVMEQFSTILFELPSLYYTMEGNFNSLISDMFKHQGITDGAFGFKYDTDGNECLKLFSAIVSILYMVLRYLQQRCNNSGDWGELQLDGTRNKPSGGADKTDLKSFLTFMGFSITSPIDNEMKGSTFKKDVLDKCFGELITPSGSDKLNKLYECALKNLRKGSADGKQIPNTIRQMILWLIGLPLTEKYKKGAKGLMEHIQNEANKINGLSNKITNDNSGLEQQLSHSIVGMLTLFDRIEGSISSVVTFIKQGYQDNGATIGQQFKYSNEPVNLLNDFSSYVTNVHVQLRFLMTMCNTEQGNGGWKDCQYTGNGSQVKLPGSYNSLTCQCSPVSSGPGPSGPGSASTNCPHLLKAFMTEGHNGASGNGANLFKRFKSDGEEHMKMGFSDFNPTTDPASGTQPPLKGSNLYVFLKELIDDIPTPTSSSSPLTKPLSLLTQYCVAIGQLHPTSLGDLFDFFSNLGNKWDSLGLHGNGEMFNEKLKKELKDYQLEGSKTQSLDTELKERITAILPDMAKHSDHINDKSLYSVMCSNTSSKCSPYMKSMNQGMYQYYVPQIDGSHQNKFPFLQWLYDMLRKLLDKMKELQKAFNDCKCCTSGSKCTGLIKCQYALPFLYKAGLVFGAPGSIKVKTCENLKEQLNTVLSFEHNKQSALFDAFECVTRVTYIILLVAAKARIDKSYDKTTKGNNTASDLKSTNSEMNDAFKLYFENAMHRSYSKLICTFACTVFDEDHQCGSCNTRFIAPGDEPQALYTHSSVKVSPQNLSSMTAVIIPYIPLHIDPYHYKTYPNCDTNTVAIKDETYTFIDAINFHIDRLQCITPTPLSLRSIIDWLLRITVGKENRQENNNIKGLTEALKTVLNTSEEVAVVENHLTSLVSGLRKFMGYEDKSNEVVENIEDEKKSLTTEVGNRIEAIDVFLTGKDGFATEMGRALQKSKYNYKKSEKSSFKTVIDELQKQLTVTHKECTDVKCTNFHANSADPKVVPTVTAGGIKELHTFLELLKKFAALWKSIGTKRVNEILQKQKDAAIGEIKYNPTSQPNVNYFTNLHNALEQLGVCADIVKVLENKSNGCNHSKDYRQRISAVINHLSVQVLSKLTDSSESNPNSASNPQFVVNACDTLIKVTKSKVQGEVTNQIKTDVEGKYIAQNGNCSTQVTSIHNHNNMQQYLCVATMNDSVVQLTETMMETYKYHLDDLKELCQWLYRMGQLFHAGLHDFVKCLIEHLQHIIEAIKWIEGIQIMVTKLKDINKKDEILTVQDLRDDIQHCCQKSEHKKLYEFSKFENREKFFTALNCRVNNLLASNILQDSDQSLGIEDDSEKRRTFLTELRLLALDRYTLQVWQDECSSEQCKIKDWITFNGGIIKCSNIDAIKKKVANLTGIDYNVPQKRTRIYYFHAICVLQKFSFQEPITRLERSLKELKEIQKQLNGVKGRCDSHNAGSDLSNDSFVTIFCNAVSKFLKDPYGIFQFAKFVHTIMGPNIFSATIGSLKELKETTNLTVKNTRRELQETSFYKSVNALLNGPEMVVGGDRRVPYKLESIITKLNEFISTLKQEYIFSYPVVSSTPSPPAGPQSSSPNPLDMVPTCYTTLHQTSSVCPSCYPYFAKIFIGSIPNIYRHCRMLYEMCKLDVNKEATWYNDRLTFTKNGAYEYNELYLSIGGYMSRNGWIVKGVNSDMDVKELYELDPNEGGSIIYGYLYDMLIKYESCKTEEPLEKLMEIVMKHFQTRRQEKIEARIQELQRSFTGNKNNSGIEFVPPPPQLPSTVRQVLFWLHELDTRTDFYDGFRDHIRALCGQSNAGISDRVISHVMKLSSTQALEVLSTVEDPGRQYATYLYDLYTEEHYYDYPTVNIPLFFYTFVEKLMGAFLELNFVCVQCEFRALEGGWSNCRFYGEDTTPSRYKRGVKCECRPSFVEYTCSKPLSAFLFSDHKNQLRIPGDVSQRLAYMSKGTMPCGFKLKNTKEGAEQITPPTTPTPTSVTGSALVEPLKKLVGGHVNERLNDKKANALSTVIYLRDLLRYTLCLAVRPPWSMSENMAFFYRVTEAWKKQGGVAQPNTQLLGAIHEQIDLFPGTFDGKQLTTAVERFAGVADKEKHETRNGAAASTNSHHYDLRTLIGCKEIKAPVSEPSVICSPFMFPLALDVYTHYDHKNSRAYLSWILNFAFGIYGQLKAMEQKMTAKTCKSSGCPSLPMCPGVLTALYQSGSSFMDQKQLAKKDTNTGSTKTCSDFHTVLQGLFNCDPNGCTPLHNLIVQCEAFLWSIRLPFSLVQLSLWSVAILFISYVFVVPLDHFKIQSHLFNRLKYTMHPSLLIADSQRRVSEVAYFTL